MNRLNFNEQIVEENEVLHKNIKTLETENKALDDQVKKLEEELTKQNRSKTEGSPASQVITHENPNKSVPPSTNEPKLTQPTTIKTVIINQWTR